jgi:hypothetical protein
MASEDTQVEGFAQKAGATESSMEDSRGLDSQAHVHVPVFPPAKNDKVGSSGADSSPFTPCVSIHKLP